MREAPTRLAAIVMTGDPEAIAGMAATCGAVARAGARVAVFFRDESIPAICRSTSPPKVVQALADLAGSGDVWLYACSTSLYLWEMTAKDLIAPICGVRGLVAFLADDLPGAQVLTY